MKNRLKHYEDEQNFAHAATEKRIAKRKRNVSELQRRIDYRALLGSLLIIASFISAYVISQSTSRMITVWSANVDLTPGEMIEDGDISLSRVALTDKAEYYLNGERTIFGAHVIRQIKANELIPAFALSESPPGQLKKVPISVSELRIADGISSGAVIDVYGVPRSGYVTSGQESDKAKSKLLLVDVAVDSINREASKLGGDIGLTLLVPSEDVGRFVESVSEFEFVLVRSA
jgi:hypothetical protein